MLLPHCSARFSHYDRSDHGFENLVKLLEENGYELYQSVTGVLVIYHREEIHG